MYKKVEIQIYGLDPNPYFIKYEIGTRNNIEETRTTNTRQLDYK